MGNLFTQLTPEDLKPISEESGFSESQVRRLYSRFCHLDKNNKGFLTKDDLRLIPELAVNPLGSRIIEAFFIDEKDPHLLLENIIFTQFVRVLAKFRKVNSKVEGTDGGNAFDKKIEFVFRVYDQDRDGYISRADLLWVLRDMVGLHCTEDQLQSIVRRTLREADKDDDEKISFAEFKEALNNIDVGNKMTIQFL